MAYASWHTTVTDLQGNVIPNASIYVVNEVTGIAPQLYADRQGTVPLGNPFTAEADGTVSLYVVGGAYRIRASFGAWERTWRYVGIGTAQEVDVEGLASMLQSGFSPVQTLADLNAITPTQYPAGGIVLADPVGANNGYYTNSGSGWVYSRPLPDTFARLYATGGTENNVQATLDAGVNPSSPTVFFIDVNTPNTGPVTLTVNGANTGPVLNAAGNPLAAGEWQGRVLFTREGNGDYKILNDPASALSAAQSASEAGTARDDAVDARNAAQTARTGAENAQSAAAGSASDAADSASAALSSANAAAGSASDASGSATAAAGSATAAGNAATTAATQAGNAASSASAAAGSATSAGNSANAAAGSATTATQQADRAEDEADRAEAAAASVGNVVAYTPQSPTSAEQAQARANIGIGDALDSTVQVVPQSFTPEQQEQARENIGAASRYDAVISRAGIEHFRTGGFIYDVVTVRSPKLHTVRKEFAPGVAPDGVVTRVPARQMAAENGYSVVINADGWRNADGTPGSDNPQGRPMGLQIANGTLYQDWTSEEHRTQAIVMMNDGKLVEANKGDGISGAQWVANGAQWSISWGMVCVRDGVPVDLTGGYVADVVSARTVIGQKPNGDIVVVMVEGISESYGATPTQCGPLMASLGCEIAYICDGGGSTQGWWENTYAVPSSDRTDVHYPMERGVVSFIVVEPDMPVQQYDSGFISVGPLNAGFTAMGGGNLPGSAPAVAVRHLGAEIKMMLRVQGTFPPNADAIIGPDGTVPYRYLYSINGPTRVFGAANGYVPVVVGFPPAGSIVAKVADTAARTQVIGYGGWPAMFSGLPTKPSVP